MISHLKFIGKGFCMGAADLVPGVSGGTVALILGIYERLLNAVKSFDLQWLKACLRLDWRQACARPDFVFLIPLFAGIVLALFVFTRVISVPGLLETHPQQLYGLFFGLIAASVLILMWQIKKFALREMAALAFGILAGAWIASLVPVATPETSVFIFFTGMIAISAMLLPGLSGSFLLLLMKKYAYIFAAIGRFDLSVLIPFALGCIAGLAAFSRILSWLLRQYHQTTLLVIKGILISSLWWIWPFQTREYAIVGGKRKLLGSAPYWPAEFDNGVMLAALLAVAGFAGVLLLHKLANRNKPPASC